MAKPKILIVEDEGIVAADLQRRVTRMGFDAPQISSAGDEAITLAERFRPSLVLMDIHLQGTVDGVTAAEAIGFSLGIPIVFLTAYSDEDTLNRVKAALPYGYLVKPFSEVELRMAIELALQNHAIRKRLEIVEALRASTLSSMADGVICLDADGQVLSMNPAAECLTGWSECEAEHHPVFQVLNVDEDAVAGFTPEGAEARETRTPFSLTIRGRHKLVPVSTEMRVSPLPANERACKGSVVVIREIKNRPDCEPSLLPSEIRASLFLQALPDAVFRLDRSGTILDAHLPASESASGDELVGTSLYSSRIPKLAVDQILTSVRWALENEEVRTLELTLPSPIGSRRQWAHIAPSGRDEAILIMRDITSLGMPGLLSHVAVEDLIKKETEFLSEAIAEALLNPLLTTCEICDHFTEHFRSYIPVEARACIRLIKETSKTMHESMDDVAFYLALKTYPMEKENLSMQQLAQDVGEDIAQSYGFPRVQVSIDFLPECFGCEPLVRRLLRILLDNALKFKRRRGKSIIEIGSQRMQDGGVHYLVKDNGIGFDDRDAIKIFGAFQKVNKGKPSQGLGLGLAIAQRIVERHEGHIWAEGKLGKGASFSFSLPYS